MQHKKSSGIEPLFQELPFGVVYQNAEGKITKANPAAEKILGLSLEQMQGRKSVDPRWRAIREDGTDFPGEEHPAMVSLRTGKKIGNVVMGVFHPGKNAFRWIEIDAIPQFEENSKKPVQVFATFKDITKEIHSRRKLEESENRYRMLVEHMHEAMFTLKDGYVTYSNITLSRMLGYSKEELMNTFFLDYVHPEDQEWVGAAYRKRQAGEEIENYYRTRVLKKNGEPLWVEVKAKLVLFDDEQLLMVMINDIDARIKAEEKYAVLFDHVADAVILHDKNGRILDVNKEALRLYGYSRAQMLQMTLKDMDSPQEHNHIPERIAQVFSNGKGRFDALHIASDGSSIPMEINVRLMRLGDQNLILSICRDIREKKQAEKALLESEARFKGIFDNSPVGIYRTTPDGRILMANPALVKMLEYDSFEDLAQYNLNKGEHYDAHTGRDLFLQQIEQKGAIYGSEAIWLTKYRRSFFVVENARAVRDEQGNTLYYEGTVEDITLRKQAEKKNVELAREYIATLKGLVNQVFRYRLREDGNYEAVLSEGKIADVYKQNTREVEGKTLKTVYGEKKYHELRPWFDEAFRGKTVQFETEEKGKWYFTRLKPFDTNPDGSVNEIIGITDDITERRKAEEETIEKNQELNQSLEQIQQMNEELKEAKEKAEESDRLKSAFLANISHEIRTPMNGILGFTELLTMPGLTEDMIQQYVQLIRKSGDRLLNIINDLLEIARIESRQIELRISPLNVNEYIKKLYNEFKPEAQNKGLAFLFDVKLPDSQAVIQTDEEKFYHIMIHLLKNAIKFTHEGAVEFGYVVKNQELEFYVQDTGMGIDTRQTKAIFEHFVQADIEISRPYDGAGLGLTIAKAYVEKLGGTIGVDTRKGEGSRFYFTLPFKQEESREETAEATEAASENKLEHVRLLIAEDDDISARYFIEVFKAIGAKNVLRARNGQEAVETVKNNPDISMVFMDNKMPEKDGNTATREIREFNREVLIVAQTAYAGEADRKTVLQNGYNDFIAKPVSKDKMQELIAKWL